MSRLTIHKRQLIVDSILSTKLGEERKSLKEVEESIAERIYNNIVPKKYADIHGSLPFILQIEGCTCLSYKVTLLDADSAGHYYFTTPEDLKTLHYKGSYSGGYRQYGELVDINDSNIVPADLKDLILETVERRSRYDTTYDSLKSESIKILKSASTIKKLIQVWPEVEEMIPKNIHSPVTTEVAKVDTSEVNKLLRSLN